jgi:hypothetical protein
MAFMTTAIENFVKKAASKRPRPRMPVVSEAMKAWAAALAEELRGWPGVTSRPMFGLIALYRGKQIFAALPRTRGMGSPSSVAFKLSKAGPRVLARLRGEERISTSVMQASRWFVFELASDRDLKDALEWLGRAYAAAN